MDQINFLAYDSVIKIIKQAKMADLGSCFHSGEIDDYFLGAPIQIEKFRITILRGISEICALEENEVKIETKPVSTIMEYKTMSDI